MRRAIDAPASLRRRPLHVDDRIAAGAAMSHQVLEQTGERIQPASHGRGRRTFLLARDPLLGDDGAMIDLAQLLRDGDAERPHEAGDIEPVGTAGARADRPGD